MIILFHNLIFLASKALSDSEAIRLEGVNSGDIIIGAISIYLAVLAP